MRSSPSTSSSARLVALGLWLLASAASAQACCAGVSILSPARLTPHEDALVALEAKTGLEIGSLDDGARFRGNPSGTGGLDLSQALVGTLRVLKEGQVTLIVPVVETARWTPRRSEAGGGLGDLSLAFRYDFVLAGESLHIPGIALLAGVAFPTGRSIEQSRQVLSSDATGAGVWQGTLGIGVEQTWGHLFGQATALVQQGLPRHVLGITETLGPTFSLGLAAGWVFDSGGALALVLTGVASLPAWIEGISTPGTARSQTSIGVGSAFPLSDSWRLQASLVTQLPLGQNQLAATTLSLLLLRTWS